MYIDNYFRVSQKLRSVAAAQRSGVTSFCGLCFEQTCTCVDIPKVSYEEACPLLNWSLYLNSSYAVHENEAILVADTLVPLIYTKGKFSTGLTYVAVPKFDLPLVGALLVDSNPLLFTTSGNIVKNNKVTVPDGLHWGYVYKSIYYPILKFDSGWDLQAKHLMARSIAVGKPDLLPPIPDEVKSRHTDYFLFPFSDTNADFILYTTLLSTADL